VQRASWTYEVPPAGSGAVGLEDYEVETDAGEVVGKVKVLLSRGADLLVVVEGGLPPAVRDVRAVRWDDVREVDHDSLRVHLRQGALERALELEPSEAVEGREAEATRVTDVPGTTTAQSAPRGPADSPTYLVALALGLLGVFSALALIAVGSREAVDMGPWWALVVVPALLLALSGIFAYRFFRRPTERR
jgi:hypothetical protein